jgi:aminoglycoside phosphotransferase (APT) family kinase protein
MSSSPIDTGLVRRLVDSQFPQWAGLPLVAVLPGGSDHVIHRLGDDLAVRLPRHSGAIGQAAKELRWLPRLAPHLPLAVPDPVAEGRPDFGYPWPWSVSRWLEGEVATVRLGDAPEVAVTLAAFLRSLQSFTHPEAPPPDGQTPDGQTPDGQTLAGRDAATRARMAAATAAFDPAALTAVWDEALAAPAWAGPPVWFHGDFHTGNLLTRDGRLSAVIDFGSLATGDPARDLMVAFTLLTPANRRVFRDALGVDEATWWRGRGWALTTGLNAFCSYAATSPRVAAQTTRQIAAAVAG